MCEKDATAVTESNAQEHRQSTMTIAALENVEGAYAGNASGSAAVEELAMKSSPDASLEHATRELEVCLRDK